MSAYRRKTDLTPSPCEGRTLTQLGQWASPEINAGERFNRHQVWYTLKFLGPLISGERLWCDDESYPAVADDPGLSGSIRALAVVGAPFSQLS